MYLLVSLLFLYFINFVLLFQTQSMVVFFGFLIFLLLVKRMYSKITSGFSSFYLTPVEWREAMRFFILLKNWNMFYIRMLDVKIYNFATIVIFIKKSVFFFLEGQIKILKLKHIQYANNWGLIILSRLSKKIMELSKALKITANSKLLAQY